MEKAGLTLRWHRNGCYRSTMDANRFAQFIRCRYYDSPRWGESVKDDATGKFWRVEIRNTDDGSMIRSAGIWTTLHGAAEEVRGLIP